MIDDYYYYYSAVINILRVQSCVVEERTGIVLRLYYKLLQIASRLCAGRGLFAFARLFPRQRLRVVIHYRPGGYELRAVRQDDLARGRGRRRVRPHVVAAGPPARGRQAPGRRRERVRHAVRGQYGRATTVPAVHAPAEAATAVVLLVLRVRGVVTGRPLHHLRPVAGHRDAERLLRVRRGAGRRVLRAVRRAAWAHNGRAPGPRGRYATGAGYGHATASDHQSLDLRPRVAVVLGGRLVRGPVVQLRRLRSRGRLLLVVLRLERPHVVQHAFFLFMRRGVAAGSGRVPARPFQRFRPDSGRPRPRRTRAAATVQSVRFRFVAIVVGVSANVRGRPVLDDLGKRVHHRLQRVIDQYREVIGPRRRPVDPARVARVPG